MLNGTYVLRQKLEDGGKRWWRFTGKIPLIVLTVFLYRGLHGSSASVKGKKGAVSVFDCIQYNKEHICKLCVLYGVRAHTFNFLIPMSLFKQN
jgi:hypothetical protein